MSDWETEEQGVRDAATLLPVVAAILLLPPFLLVAAAPVLVAGIPLIVVYVFSVWAIIILCAFLVGRRISRRTREGGDPPETAGGG